MRKLLLFPLAVIVGVCFVITTVFGVMGYFLCGVATSLEE